MTAQLPFRARLTLAYAIIVTVAVVLLGAVAFLTVRITLDTTRDTRLETTAEAIRSIADVKHGRLKPFDAEDREQFQTLLSQSVNGAVFRLDGTLMTSNLASLPSAIVSAIKKPAPSHGTLAVAGKPVSYVTLAITERGIRYGTAVAWESRSGDDNAATITLIGLAIAGVFVIAAAVTAGGTLARQMLRPVTELSAMISEIEATDLTERLAWAGPDDELGRLCTTFDRLLDRLETAIESERRFIADASHELRTPVSVMRAEVELALMQDRSPDAYRGALQRLQRETQRLEALAQSLILTTRADGAGLASVPTVLADVAARATARMQPLASACNVTLHCEAGSSAKISADADMLEQAVIALIDNALRFANTAVSVSVSSDGINASLAVSDDGPGFSESGLRDATGRFWRDDPARSGAGTGLGLAIARSTVERHNGTILLRNAPDRPGAIVVLTVPASEYPSVTSR